MSPNSLAEKVQKKLAFLKQNPHASRAIFEAKTRLEEGTRCTANVRGFPTLVVDEPPELGGEDAGMNPLELLLASLGTCQEIIYALYGAALGVPLDDVEVSVKGQVDVRGMFGLDSSVPVGFQKVTYETRIKSSADEAAVAKLVRIVEAACPVLDTLTRPVATSGNVVLNGQPLADPASRAA